MAINTPSKGSGHQMNPKLAKPSRFNPKEPKALKQSSMVSRILKQTGKPLSTESIHKAAGTIFKNAPKVQVKRI